MFMALTSAFLVKPKKRGKFAIFLICLSFLPLTSFIPKLFPFGIKKVVIDAGHGGHDPGCIGFYKTKEKDVALKVSLKLGKLIEENMKDVQVIYTRSTDEFIELKERAAIANRNKADLFISIHCNASENRAHYGAETFVMGLHKTKENLSVAKRENAAILMEENYEKEYDGFDPKSDEANIMFALFQSAFLEQSLGFAAKVQSEFTSKPVERFDRGVKQAGFLVLYMTTMPSVLVELGFLSNKEEEIYLASENGQTEMANTLFKAFKSYKYDAEKKTEKEDPKILLVKDKKEPTADQQTEAAKPQGIVFKVQFASSTAYIKPLPQNFKGLKNVEANEVSGIFRYMIGSEKNLEDVKKVLEEVKEKGYNDAFIVSFKNGEKITVTDALKELNQ
jgi:N-acetylmuramoyl-L-alanine amidase